MGFRRALEVFLAHANLHSYGHARLEVSRLGLGCVVINLEL